MTTELQRSKWATFNTWAKDRRKAKRVSRRAQRELQQLLNQAPAALEAAREKEKSMTRSWEDDAYWTEEAMEARQQARIAAIKRCGTPAPRPRAQQAPKQPTEREQLLAAGFTFTVAEQDRADAEAETRARRRRADEAVARRERIYKSLSNTLGPDEAEAWMRGGGDAA